MTHHHYRRVRWPPMKRWMRLGRLLFVISALLVLISIAVPASAHSDDPWTFEGGGWGHGVGLSQYGSQGLAVEGLTAAEIIDFYYSGADVKPKDQANGEPWLDDPEAIWVGLSQNLSIRAFQAVGGPIDVCLAGDGSDSCAVPDVSLSNGQVLTVARIALSDPLRCEIRVDAGPTTEGDCWVDLSWDEAPATRRVKTGGLQLARGSVHVRPNHTTTPDAFHVSVSVDLEDYIYGIAETLLQWHPETLETQAIIARSYGVDKAMTSANSSGVLWSNRMNLCWCHIGSTSSDQNYDGWDVDTEGSSVYGQKWRNAVDNTAGEIVTHPQRNSGTTIISTFYSSSNGGASENNEDVWGGAPLPWLRSVADPWSANPALNPLASWTVLVSGDDMATALGWDHVLDAAVLDGPPGVEVRFTGKRAGSNVETVLNGTQIAAVLKTYGYKADGSSVRVSPYIVSVTDPPGFDDIQGSVFENAINWLADEGITLGCNPPANDLFCPTRKVTRGEMAVFISRARGLPAPSSDHFTDDNGKFYESAANRLFEAGITAGCGGTKYCGDQNLPREQMAVLLVRALGLPPTEVDYFVDDENSPFEGHINRIAEAKITLGCNPPTNDRFCPTDTVTRGQMAAFFKRAWG
jgi:peptidoglycan hydrolase-like amidase